MNFNEFHNALRIMRNIDMDEFVHVIDPDTDGSPPKEGNPSRTQWAMFHQNPYTWFIRAPDAQAERLFAYIETRQPKEN